MFSIPYSYPAPSLGLQIFNPGEGGPQSHMDLQPSHLRFWPTSYRVGPYGLGAMPRQWLGPSLPIVNNNIANPSSYQNLVIPGIFKPPFGG
jgi:hypothetical protein